MTEHKYDADGSEDGPDGVGKAVAAEDSGGGAGGPGSGTESQLDEAALRRLLQTVVDDIEPAPESLEHLRRAVPARRARKRQALVGAVAAVVLASTAVPALVHVAGTSGTAEDRPANAASSQRTQGGTDGEEQGGQGSGDSDKPSGATGDKEESKGGTGAEEDGRPEEKDGGTGGGADPSETMAVSSPSCTGAQLGPGGATVSGPDAEGKIYGSFRVVNTSATDCAVSGAGVVSAVPQGSAESMPVVDHTAGDAATDLPDPAMAPAKLILTPKQAYEVRFAYVPPADGTGSCPTPGASPDPSSSGSTGGDPSAQSSGATQASVQSAAEEPVPPPSGNILLSHTPESGEPATAQTTTIKDVCSGTIYRTGVLEAS